MDIDNSDIDLISYQFRSMNTNDKDHLISEFKRLSKTELSNEGCCFYLDLAEWNLNTALWAYYEYETAAAAASLSSSILNASNHSASNNTSVSLMQLPQIKLDLNDITVGEGESVAPSTIFIKTWRILNNGM